MKDFFWKTEAGFALANPAVFGYNEKKRFKALRQKRFCRSLKCFFIFHKEDVL